MINKNDYGSYEAPEVIPFTVETEHYCQTSSPGAAGSYGDDDTNDNGDYDD